MGERAICKHLKKKNLKHQANRMQTFAALQTKSHMKDSDPFDFRKVIIIKIQKILLGSTNMGLIHAAAMLAIDNRFRIPSLELKCLGTSFGAQKQKFSIPLDLTWPPCD